MNRQAFFAFLRTDKAPMFGNKLSDNQVAGLTGLLDVWATFFAARYPFTFLAAALGQVFRETGGKMWPVLEAYAADRQQAARRLEAAFVAGKLKWVRTRYWLPDESGQIGVGGGFIQETHRANYVKAEARILKWFGIECGLAKNYDLILDPTVSALAMFTGMIDGSYRKTALRDYVRGDGMDYRGAREIVNGDTKHVGNEIVRNCLAFEMALRAAGADKNFGPAEEEPKLPAGCVIRVPERFIRAGGRRPEPIPVPGIDDERFGPPVTPPAPPAQTTGKGSNALGKAILVAIGAALAWLATQTCNIFGAFC
jgi:hypothetical protein